MRLLLNFPSGIQIHLIIVRVMSYFVMKTVVIYIYIIIPKGNMN